MPAVISPQGTIRPATFRTSGYYFLGFLVVAIVAFWPSYFGRELSQIDFWFTGAQTAWWLRLVTWFRDLPLT